MVASDSDQGLRVPSPKAAVLEAAAQPPNEAVEAAIERLLLEAERGRELGDRPSVDIPRNHQLAIDFVERPQCAGQRAPEGFDVARLFSIGEELEGRTGAGRLVEERICADLDAPHSELNRIRERGERCPIRRRATARRPGRLRWPR